MRIRTFEAEIAKVQGIRTYTVRKDAAPSKFIPKTMSEKAGTGALNIIFGADSYLEGGFAGGLTVTAGYVATAGLFVAEAAAPDRDSPAAIGVTVAGLSVAYSFVRPFIGKYWSLSQNYLTVR